MIELHRDDAEITSRSIADRANQMDEEATPLTSEKVGWLTRRLGLPKARVPGSGRRIICWNEEKMRQLAALHGLNMRESPSSETLSQPSHLSQPDVEPACDGVGDGSGVEQKPSQVFEANRDGCDSSEGFCKDTEKKLGMTIDEAVAVWSAEGRPVIHLGPGENCLDLEKLLSHRDINERHLAAIRDWLEKRQR